ncbi:MAG: ComF family protein [Ruminococcus sp.]
MTDFIDKLKDSVKDILFPVRCPYCETVISKTEYACEDCKKKFPSPAIIKYAVGGYKCTSPFPYDGIFKKAVKKFKFGNKGGYAKQLAFPMVQSILESYPGVNFDLITCVPMHKKRLIERGYNQAELLAKECAKIMNIPYFDTLEKFRENREQHSIKASERAKNVRGVYRTIDKELVTDKNILIIDDIITTGNTLGECAGTLIKSGCNSVNCAVLCSVIMN